MGIIGNWLYNTTTPAAGKDEEWNSLTKKEDAYFLGRAASTALSPLLNGATTAASGLLNSGNFLLNSANNNDNPFGNYDAQSILNYYVDTMLSSATEAERQATLEHNQWQELQNQKAMDFSANQADLNRLFQQKSAQDAMNFTAQQNKEAMQFSERMSNTAYQRAVADLQAAGLNPILAVTNGGASSPAGIAGSGISSSGSSASGISSSGSKANVSSARQADLNAVTSVFNLLGNVFNSASGIVSSSGSKKSVIDGILDTADTLMGVVDVFV